jgi:hypothetical protein
MRRKTKPAGIRSANKKVVGRASARHERAGGLKPRPTVSHFCVGSGRHGVPFDEVRGKPFDDAQDGPFDGAQGRHA